MFIAEGVRLLEEAIRHQYFPQRVFHISSNLAERTLNLLDKFQNLGISLQEVSSKEMSRLSDTDNNQGILGLFEIEKVMTKTTYTINQKFILLLDNISDPGNAGTLLRSALAFGFNFIMVTENTVDLFNPKVIRSTAGAIFGLKIAKIDTNDIANFLQNCTCALAAADINGEDITIALKQIQPNMGIILAVGGESHGLTDDIKKMSNLMIKIEHFTAVESLNAAVAGSIIMREIFERFSKYDTKIS